MPKVNWKEVFTRSRADDHDFFVRKAYQKKVIAISAEVARSGGHQYFGGMLSYAGESITLNVLDGYCCCIKGQFYGGPNGTWVSGGKFMRYLLYRLKLGDPRKLKEEAEIFSFEELTAEIEGVEKRIDHDKLRKMLPLFP